MSKKKKGQNPPISNSSRLKRRERIFRWIEVVVVVIGVIFAAIQLVPTLKDLFTGVLAEVFSPQSLLSVDLVSPEYDYDNSNTGLSITPVFDDPTSLVGTYQYWQTLFPPCLDRTLHSCKVHVFLSQDMSVKGFKYQISSKSRTFPIIPETVSIKLRDYKPLPKSPLNMIYYIPLGGGGGGMSIYTLKSFPVKKTSYFDVPYNINVTDPSAAIGVSSDAEFIENNPDMQVSLKNSDQPQGIRITLPFINDLPAGWYEFEVSFIYQYQSNRYSSKQKIYFDLVKPEIAQPWILKGSYYINGNVDVGAITKNDYYAMPSTYLLDLNSMTAKSNIKTKNLEKSYALLVYGSVDTFDFSYNLIDLHNNSQMHLGKIGSANATFFDKSISPLGDKIVGITMGNTRKGDFEYNDSFVHYMDLQNGVRYSVEKIANIRQLNPEWSPDGTKIAYLGFAFDDNEFIKKGESEIFVYDVNSHTTTKITNSPKIMKAAPVWISDYEIAYGMPETTDNRPNTNTGINLFNLRTDRTITISNILFKEGSDLKFLQENVFVILTDGYGTKKILSLDGKVLQEFNKHGDNCYVLDTNPVSQVCDDKKTISIYQGDTLASTIMSNKYDNFGIGPVLAKSSNGGFIIVDPGSEQILQYDSAGNFVNYWEVPDLYKVMSWGVNEMYLIPGERLEDFNKNPDK